MLLPELNAYKDTIRCSVLGREKVIKQVKLWFYKPAAARVGISAVNSKATWSNITMTIKMVKTDKNLGL